MGHLNAGGIGDPLKSMKDKERWREFCEQAAVEQDPKKLMVLVAEITRLLDAKQERLKGPPKEQ
jgi:hypothetical protein